MKLFAPFVLSTLFVAAHSLAQTQINPPAAKAHAGIASQNLGLAIKTVVQCPASIDTAATNAPSPWLPNSVRLYVDSVTLTNQPVETQQMVCRYKGSGFEWAVMQPIRPTYKSCIAIGKSSFTCAKY